MTQKDWYREQAERWGGNDEHDDVAVMHPDNSYYFARLAAHFGRLALAAPCTCDVDAFDFDCPVHGDIR